MGQIKQAMILAAGLGLRAKPLTMLKPKPLLPVLNRPLIDHTLDLLIEAGVEKIIVNTHHLASQIEDELTKGRSGLSIRVLREDKILGTGGGAKNAAPYLERAPLILINGAILTRIDLNELVNYHLAHRPLATLTMIDSPRFNNDALVGTDDLIKGFRGEWAGRPESRTLGFAGIHIIETEVLDRIPEGPGDIIEVYQNLIKDGKPIRAFIPVEPGWWKIETIADYLKVHSDLLTRRTEGPVLTGPGVRVEPGAEIRGWACLGEGAVVESGAVVQNSVLWPGARVRAGVEVRDSVVTENVTVYEDLIGGVGFDRIQAR